MRTDVVVIGAGPSGLATAIELGTRGVPCGVLERQLRAGHAPRAKTTHTRTCEHLRRWGIAEKLAAASPFGVDYPADVLFVTRLAGELIVRFEGVLNCSPEQDERYSEHSQWIPQYKLEAVLLEHAGSGTERPIDAQYLVGGPPGAAIQAAGHADPVLLAVGHGEIEPVLRPRGNTRRDRWKKALQSCDTQPQRTARRLHSKSTPTRSRGPRCMRSLPLFPSIRRADVAVPTDQLGEHGCRRRIG